MGEKPAGDEPSLELPHLFGRKKKDKPTERDVAEPTAVIEPTVGAESEPTAVIEPEAVRSPEPGAVVHEEPATDREFRLPELDGRVASVITGVLVGLFGALLTWGGLKSCETFKGTDSCGGEGFFLLLFILLLMILSGGLLLAAWDVADPKSTSALGVGVVCILILLLLMENLFDAWMFAVVPVISALAYYAAYWVTTALVDESALESEPPPTHDVR